MRVIILNMMVLGAVSCLVENDVFAKGNISFADRIKLTQSGNLVGEEDFSDSFDQLFSSDETKSKKERSGSDKTNDSSQSQNTHVVYGGTAQSDSLQFNVEDTRPDPLQPAQKNNINVRQQSPNQARSANELQLPSQGQEDNKDTVSLDAKARSDSLQFNVEGTRPDPLQPAQKNNINVESDSNKPAPPPAMMGNTKVPPPPGSPIREVNVSNLIRDLRDKQNDLLVSDGAMQMANIVNFYLQGNNDIISEGIVVSAGAAALLINRLNKELEILEKKFASDSTIKEFCDLLKSLRDPLQKLNKQSYYAIDSDRGKFFKDISQEIKKIATSYFSKFMESGENLKSIPNLIASLKEADIVMERAVVLSNSFSNLVDLSEMPRIKEFTERATLDAIEIIRLKRFFAAKLKEANSASSNSTAEENASTSSKQVDLKPLSGSITLPTGNSVTEKVVVEKALHCIEETLSGNNQLSVLLDIRDILNNNYTAIVSKEEGDKTKSSPLNVIRRLNDRIKDVGVLLGKAGKIEKTKIKTEKDENKEIVVRNNNYSQFGKMFTEKRDEAYGTALIPSVNSWISSEEFTEFNGNEITAAFRGKQLIKNESVIEEYLRLITEDKALCNKSFTDSIINKINSQVKFKSNAYAFGAKQSKQKTESKMEDHQFLFEIMTGDGKTKLGTSSDPKKDKNMISFSTLKKNCEGYIMSMASIDEDIREIPEMLKKVERSFSVEIDNEKFAEYVNNILKNYFVFEDFVTHADKINLSVVNKKEGLLSEKDVPNIVFALAQNCGLVVKQPASPLFSISRNTDNIWVFKMSRDLFAIISKTKKAILDTHAQIFSGKKEITKTKIEEIIKKLEDQEKLIGNAIHQDEVLENVVQGLSISVSKTKADAKEEAERVPAENIDEIKLGKITDQVQNLSRLADDLPNPYAQNNQSKIQTIKTVIEEVISLLKTASDTKAKAKLSQKPNRRDARFIR